MRRSGAREQCGIARYLGRVCVYSMMQIRMFNRHFIQ